MEDVTNSAITPELANSINAVFSETAELSNYLISIADDIVKSYSDYLDAVMQAIYTDVVTNKDCSDDTLEKYFLELSSTLYFVGEQVERIGISNDVAESNFKEKFNTMYLNACAEKDEKGKSIRTVNENTAVASESSKYEKMVSEVQSRAYELLKYKVGAAQTMVGTLSKMISKKMSDASLTMTTNRGTQDDKI